MATRSSATDEPASAALRPTAVAGGLPSRRRRRARTVCWWLGVSFLVAALATALAAVLPAPGSDESLGFVTPVIGSWVPTTGSVFLIVLVFGVGLHIAARALAPAPRRPVMARAVRSTLLVILCIAAVPAGVLVALSGSDYRVLPGAGSGGCRIVVQEFTFLYASHGHVGIVQPGSATVEWDRGAVAGYTADDGYKPFASGTYRLDWDGPAARLSLWGTGSTPASWSSGAPPDLVCAR